MNSLRRNIFFLSLAALILTCSGIFFLIQSRKPPKSKSETFGPKGHVRVKSVSLSTEKVEVECFGTVRTTEPISLVAGISGKASSKSALHPGKFVEADQVLYEIDTTKLDVAIGRAKIRIHELEADRLRLENENTLLLKRLEHSRDRLGHLRVELALQEDNVTIEAKLLENNAKLDRQNNIPKNDFLRQQASHIQAKVQSASRKRQIEDAKLQIAELESALNKNTFDLTTAETKIQDTLLEIQDLENDRKKGKVTAQVPALIQDIQVRKEQEVTTGTPLLTLRGADKVELEVTLPDSHFSWLYQGSLLQSFSSLSASPSIDIHLVNRTFKKTYQGGYIKAVGERVRDQSRSLPIIIERINPTEASGVPIQKEELKPGMYCEIILELAEVPNVYLLPEGTLQSAGKLYRVLPEGSKNLGTLQIIDHFETLYEGPRGALIRIEGVNDTLLLVAHPLRQAKDGLLVTYSSED